LSAGVLGGRWLMDGIRVMRDSVRSPYRSIRSTFEDACARAKLADVGPHTLRHTFASRLAMAGVDLRTIQELGGWATLKMVERYAHLSPKHKAEAVERIAENFPTEITTPTSNVIALAR
jgi:site-specific recombinase XerD